MVWSDKAREAAINARNTKALDPNHPPLNHKSTSVQDHYKNHPSYKSEIKKQEVSLAQTAVDPGIDPKTGRTRVASTFNENKYKR